jgi:hypothetical protein
MGIGIGQSQCRQPRKMADGRVLAKHKPTCRSSEARDVHRRDVGCSFVVLKRALPQSHFKMQAPDIQPRQYEQFKALVI